MQSCLPWVYPGEKSGGTEQTPRIQSRRFASDQTDQISAPVEHTCKQVDLIRDICA